MKKILALLLASVMALSLAACGGNTSDETTDTTGTTENNTTTEANPADAISDTMTSEAVSYTHLDVYKRQSPESTMVKNTSPTFKVLPTPMLPWHI